MSVSPAENASFPAYYAYDGRAQSLFKFGSSSSSATFTIDRGAGTLEAVDRLVIPSGHNLGSQSVTITSDDNAGFATPTTLASFTSAAGLINQALTSSTERYLRVAFGGTGTWELPEVWIGRVRTPAVGPRPEWTRARQPNYQRVQFDSGVTAGSQIGPMRWAYAFAWTALAGTDLAIFSDLEAAVSSAGERLWMMTPDSDVGLLLMELSEPMQWRQDHPVPGNAVTGPTWTVALKVIEAIG